MVTDLRYLRHRKMMTQKELAAALGTTYQTVQRWESGESAPRPAARRKLCEVLDVTPDVLLTALSVINNDDSESNYNDDKSLVID